MLVDPEKYPYDGLPPIPNSYGISAIVASIVGFQILNEICVKVGLPDSVDAKDTWKYRNLVISWTHALIVGIWDLTW